MAFSLEYYEKWKKQQEVRKANLYLDTPTIDENYIKQYGADVSKFLTDSANNSGNIKWGQSQTALNSFDNQAVELKYKQILINDWLSKNAQPGSYDELSKSFDSVNTSINDLRELYSSLNTSMSGYKTADEYNAAVVNEKFKDSTYDEILAEINRLGEEQNKQTPEQAAETQKTRDTLNRLLYSNSYKDKDSYDKAIADIDRQIARLEAFIKASKSQYAGGGVWDKGGTVTNDTSAQEEQLRQLKSKRTIAIKNKNNLIKDQTYTSMQSNTDFGEYSHIGATTGHNVDVSGTLKQISDSYNVERQKDSYIEQNLIDLYFDIVEKYPKLLEDGESIYTVDKNIQPGGLNSGLDAFITYYKDLNVSAMTDLERSIYNYIFATQGFEAADKYIHDIADTLNERKGRQNFEKIEGKTLQEILFGIESGFDQFTQGIFNLGSNEDYIPQSITQYTGSFVREDLADAGFKLPKWLGGASIGQLAFDGLQTTANMAPSVLTSIAVGTVSKVGGALVGNALLGGSAWGNAYAEMVNLGYDKNQAKTYANLVAASEAGLSVLLSGVGKLGGALTKSGVAKLASKFDKVWSRAAVSLAGKMASEGLEEYLQEVLTPVFKNYAFYTDEEIDLLSEDALYAALLGMLSVVPMEGAGSVNEAKRSIAIDELVKTGLNMPSNSEAYRLATEISEMSKNDITPKQLEKLVDSIKVETTKANKETVSAIENRIIELGETGDTNRIAWAIFNSISGNKLSETEQNLIKNSVGYKTMFSETSQESNPENATTTKQDSPFAEMKSQISADAKEPFVGVNSDIEYTAEQAEIMARISDLILNEGRDIYSRSGRPIKPEAVGLDFDSELYKELKSAGLTDSKGNIRGLVFLDEASRREGKVGEELSNTDASDEMFDFLDDQKVYPEVSAEGPEADWFADEAFKARGLERLTDDQKFIKAVGKALGCEVEFKNLDRWVTDENGKRKRVSPNGRYDKNTGKIYINTSSYTKHDALQFIFKHELTHFAESDIKAYTNFANGVMDSPVFKQWVKSKGYTDSEQVSATMAMNKDYINDYRTSGIKSLEKFDETDANMEMVADFVAENLFSTDLSKLQNALSYVDNETRSKFMQFVLDLLEKLRSVFKGNQSRYMNVDSIEAEFIKVCEAAKEVWEQKQTKSTETAQNKKSTDEGGKSYSLVVASTDILDLVQKVKSGNFKANEKVYFENISDGLAAKIQKLTGVNVKNFKVAIEARQVEHILKDHGENGKSDHSMSSDEDIAKMEYVLKNPDDLSLAGKTQAYSYMKNGYNKTADTVLYEKSIGDKSYYVVQAIPDTKAKTLYVVSAFIGEKGYKKETSQLINAKSPDATAKSGSVVVSNNRIAQNEPSVNNYSMQGVDENTQSAKNSDNEVVSADSNSKEKFSFAGERAKTANVKTLDEAKQFEADGVDSETIRKQTGWFKGYDNKWRFEINDRDMKVDLDVVSNACRNFDLVRLWELQNFLRKDLNKEKFNEFCDMLHNLNEAKFKKIMLSDILEHDALFKAYPQLKNIKVEFINLPMHVDGQYDASTNTINVSLELLVVKRKLDTTLIHEIQHAIQEIEEFTTGTNLEFWAYYRYDGRTRALEKRYEEILVKFPKRMQTLIRKIDRALENRDYDVAAEFEETIKNSKYSDLYNQYADVRARQAYAEKIRNDKRNNEQLYFDSAGEREARDVETRLKWTDEERQNNRPDVDYDDTVFVDKEYLEYLETLYNMAIEKGFDEQADKLVGAIAKSNGYNLKLYHQTTSGFNVFDTRHKGAGSVDYETPHGIFLKPDEGKIGIKGEKQMPLYTKMNNPLTVDDRDALTQWYRDNVTGYLEAESSIEKIGIGYKVKLEKAEKAASKYLTDYRKSNPDKPSSAVYDDVKFNELCDAKDRIVDEWGKAYDEQAKKTKELLDDFFKSSEYDGVHIKSDVGSYGRQVETYIAFEPEQVKSADAITYSDNGGKIALANRFDEESQDIRYSLPRSKVNDLFERYKNGEISEEKFKSLISETPEQNPVSIAKIKKSQVSTTPQVEKNAGENKGGKQSNVYESLKGSDIFDDKFKRDITNDSWVKSYGATTNKETLSKACKVLDDGGTGYVERLKFAKPNEVSLIDIAAGLILIDRYQRVGDYEGSIAFAEKVREWGTASGQQVQIFSILGRFNPDSMVTYAQKELDKAFEAMIESKTNRWVQKNKKELKLNAEDIEFIRRRTLQAALLEDGTRQKAILLAEICTRIQDKIPPDSGQAIRALQRMSMLLNIKTNIRNVVGNASMVPVYITSDFFGAGIDKLIAKKTGVRTTGTFKTKGSVKAFGKGLYESYDDFKRGIHTKQEELNRFEVNPQSAKNFNEHHNGVLAKQLNDIAKFLNKMDSFTSFCLEAGDRPFYEMWFNNSLNRQLELNGTDTPTMDMLEIAKTEALQRTWQDDSTLARSVAKIKATCNLAHLPGTSYGLGDMITKFTKTPANISKAIIDFSPLGLISAGTDFYKMSEAIKKGRFTPQMQKKAVRSLSNAIVGTIVYALVGFGAAMGVVKLSGAGDDDKDVSNFEKYIVGIPPYSINVFGHNVTYDWMQPFGSVLAIVAEYSENSKNKSNGFFDDVYNALLTGGNVFCEQSFLQGFQDIFAQDSLIEALLIAAINDPATFIPQWSSQVASFIDDKRRVSYEPTDEFQSSINKIIAKVPGLRQLLPEQVNVLGETVENNQYLDPWKAFAQPWNDYPESSGKVAEEVYELYKSTGDKTVMPRVALNSITVKGRKYSFDAKQKTDYQRKLGNNSRDMLEILFESKQYNKLTDEEKAKVVKKIYDYSTKLAKVEVVAYEYDYEFLSSMVGKSANGKPILTESMYNKLNSKAKKRIIEEYLLSKNELKFKTSKDAVEYYINQVK